MPINQTLEEKKMYQSFYLKKPSTFTFYKSYKVFIKEGKLFFFKIDYKLDEDNDVWFPYSELIYIARDIIYKKLADRNENRIDLTMQNNTLELLWQKGNFQLDIIDIKCVELNETLTYHSFSRDSGSLSFVLHDNQRFKFIMPSRISIEFIKNLLEEEGVSFEVQHVSKH